MERWDWRIYILWYKDIIFYVLDYISKKTYIKGISSISHDKTLGFLKTYKKDQFFF